MQASRHLLYCGIEAAVEGLGIKVYSIFCIAVSYERHDIVVDDHIHNA